MTTLLKIFSSIVLAVSSFFAPAHTAGGFTPVEGTVFYIAKTVQPTDTTITLSTFATPNGQHAYTMADFGSIGYLTLDPTNSAKLETISFTGITQNPTNAVLTGVTRGIDFVYPYAASTTLAYTHLVGSTAILSNPAAFYGQQFLFANQTGTSTAILVFSSTTPAQYDELFAVSSSSTQIPPAGWIYNNFLNDYTNQTVSGSLTLTGNNTLTGSTTYTGGPNTIQGTTTINVPCGSYSSNAEVCPKSYIDNVAISGAPNANTTTKGIVQEATYAQMVAGTVSGSTGADLYVNPGTLAKTYASTTIEYASGGGSNTEVSFSVVAGNVVEWWVSGNASGCGGSNSITVSAVLKQSTMAASTTQGSGTNGFQDGSGSCSASAFGFYQATTTESVNVQSNISTSGASANDSRVMATLYH